MAKVAVALETCMVKKKKIRYGFKSFDKKLQPKGNSELESLSFYEGMNPLPRF